MEDIVGRGRRAYGCGSLSLSVSGQRRVRRRAVEGRGAGGSEDAGAIELRGGTGGAEGRR